AAGADGRARKGERGLARGGGERRHVRRAGGVRASWGAVQSSIALALPRGDGGGHRHDRGCTVGTFFHSRERKGRFFSSSSSLCSGMEGCLDSSNNIRGATQTQRTRPFKRGPCGF